MGSEQLVYLSHWTTPEVARKRFATWFFLAVLEEDQEVIVDGGEIAHHRWVTPEVALAELRDEDHPFRLMPPTFVSLVDIAPFSCCQDARAGIASRPFEASIRGVWRGGLLSTHASRRLLLQALRRAVPRCCR